MREGGPFRKAKASGVLLYLGDELPYFLIADTRVPEVQGLLKLIGDIKCTSCKIRKVNVVLSFVKTKHQILF